MSDAPPLATFATTANAASLKAIRAFVRAAVEAAGAAPEEVQDTVLAVDEACQNVVRHAYAREVDDRPLELEIRGGPDTIRIVLRDAGTSIDLTAIPTPPPDALRPGGRGLYLMRTVMDRVEHRPGSGGHGNELTLIKRLGRGTR